MQSVLIVEDEKMIRKGIHSMIERTDVEIGEILECRNGEEAFELLKTRSVDVMMTDIRMPKMDGISLIKAVSTLPVRPKIIVLSGFDDFSYVVEAMKNGAKDYLLKPIEREKINHIFKQLEQELEDEHEDKETKIQLQKQQLKYYLLSDDEDEQEDELLKKQLQTTLFYGRYVVCTTAPQKELPQQAYEMLQLNDMDGQTVFVLHEEDVEAFAGELLPECYLGISRAYSGVELLKCAYTESRAARKDAFVSERHVCRYEEKEPAEEKIPRDFVEHFVQKFGTNNMEKGILELKNYYFKSRMGKVDTERLLEVTADIWQQLYNMYQNIIALDIASYTVYKQPLSYNCAREYLDDFAGWMEQMKQLMDTEFDDYRNKEKINQAIAYIGENYSKNLNMAMVSNHVSMNYSLFSVTFKQYTGKNFVNYLKDIRLGEAKNLLETTELKIIEISQMVGYDNEKHFMKLFKATHGVSPTEYRKNVQIGKGNISSHGNV